MDKGTQVAADTEGTDGEARKRELEIRKLDGVVRRKLSLTAKYPAGIIFQSPTDSVFR